MSIVAKVCCALGATVMAASVLAQDPALARKVQSYKSMSEASLLICSLNYQNSLMRAKLGQSPDQAEDIQACLDRERSNNKAQFQKVLESASPSQAESLKGVRVAWLMAIEGIPAGPGELRVNYDARQQALKGKLAEAWIRYQVDN